MILTGYYVKSKKEPYAYIPAVPDNTVITDDTNVTLSEWRAGDLCVVMKNSDVKHWLLTYCHDPVSSAICMWPVTCPEDYEKVGTICYKLIESPSPEPTFLDAPRHLQQGGFRPCPPDHHVTD
ncbi:uncharacterized protein LOC135089499 [Scylla paramamosain]|uniref:uncharacterized protein LOC135089499 n=1 Tax=Scylla paramamosain TaxID=85552 RepID=UPI003083BD3B